MLDWNDIESYRIAYKNKLRIPRKFCEENINNMFQEAFGFTPNIKNPRFLSEKLQWLKFNDKNPLLVTAQDKFLSKEYFKEKGIDSSFIPKTLDVLNEISSINLDTLPEQFVIKTNHLSGVRGVFPVFDKSELTNLSETNLDKLSYIQSNLEYPNRGALSIGEWWYLHIESKLYVEEMLIHDHLEFDDGKKYRGEFRVYCFHGEPKLFFFNHDPDDLLYPYFENKRCPATYYNKDWKQINLAKCVLRRKDPVWPSNIGMIKPDFFNDMYDICRLVSEDFAFMRVDLIPSKEGLKINELTPSPSSGVFRYEPYPEDIDLIMGDLLDLSKIKPYKPFQYKK